MSAYLYGSRKDYSDVKGIWICRCAANLPECSDMDDLDEKD